ncbi:MAG: GDP-mannose 4,6-dehydratase [Clostridia bacterium]|nr:GDP-mannose 4,6-dehydratase [Clostridia bacterium]
MKTILVTGGAGFIGSNLCEKLLELGYGVINVDNFNDFYDPLIKRRNILKAQTSDDYTVFENDILDRTGLEYIFQNFNIDKVVHLAALAGVRKSLDNPLQYVDVDIKGTVNLLELAVKYGVKKFVFASSSSVYGTNAVPFREDDRLDIQVSPYAAAKYCGEVYCRTYNSLYSLPTVCLRFFTVYGPRQRPEMAIHSFTRLIDEGMEVPVFGNGTSSRDYTYIDDIINGIVSSIDLQCGFEVFNLGNSEPIQLNSLVHLIGQKLGKPVNARYLPVQKGDVERTYADISKAERLLKYSPGVGIEEGIERFIDWYRQMK